MLRDSPIRYTQGNEPGLGLCKKPALLENCRPRRHRFTFPRRLVRDRIYSLRNSVVILVTELEGYLLDEVFRLVDLSNVYQIDVWFERREDIIIVQLLLTD